MGTGGTYICVCLYFFGGKLFMREENGNSDERERRGERWGAGGLVRRLSLLTRDMRSLKAVWSGRSVSPWVGYLFIGVTVSSSRPRWRRGAAGLLVVVSLRRNVSKQPEFWQIKLYITCNKQTTPRFAAVCMYVRTTFHRDFQPLD